MIIKNNTIYIKLKTMKKLLVVFLLLMVTMSSCLMVNPYGYSRGRSYYRPSYSRPLHFPIPRGHFRGRR